MKTRHRTKLREAIILSRYFSPGRRANNQEIVRRKNDVSRGTRTYEQLSRDFNRIEVASNALFVMAPLDLLPTNAYRYIVR